MIFSFKNWRDTLSSWTAWKIQNNDQEVGFDYRIYKYCNSVWIYRNVFKHKSFSSSNSLPRLLVQTKQRCLGLDYHLQTSYCWGCSWNWYLEPNPSGDWVCICSRQRRTSLGRLEKKLWETNYGIDRMYEWSWSESELLLGFWASNNIDFHWTHYPHAESHNRLDLCWYPFLGGRIPQSWADSARRGQRISNQRKRRVKRR